MTKIQEIDTQTQEVVKRDANEIELNMIRLQKEAHEQKEAEAQAKAQAKIALLERLGITEDEAKLLLA